jgi:RES domain-containing protein
MARWSPRFAAFLVKAQWIDRKATSSFIVGITVQTAVLSLGLTQMQASDAAIVQAATRAALMVALTVCSLGAMSAFQNEYRYETVWLTARDLGSFHRLMFTRAVAMVVVSMPAVAVPFGTALVLVGPRERAAGIGLLALATGAVLVAYTHLLTLVLALTYDPARVVPWVRHVTLASLVGVVPFLSPPLVSRAFPFVWLSDAALDGRTVRPVVVAVAIAAGWSLLGTLVLRRGVARAVGRRLVDNVEAR